MIDIYEIYDIYDIYDDKYVSMIEHLAQIWGDLLTHGGTHAELFPLWKQDQNIWNACFVIKQEHKVSRLIDAHCQRHRRKDQIIKESEMMRPSRKYCSN